jgi:hypothetical protein
MRYEFGIPMFPKGNARIMHKLFLSTIIIEEVRTCTVGNILLVFINIDQRIVSCK